MRLTVFISAILHVSAFMLAYVALPEFREELEIQIVVPVAILSEADIADEISVPETVTEEEFVEEAVIEEEPEPLPPEPEPEPEPVVETPPEEVVPPLPGPEPEVEEAEPEVIKPEEPKVEERVEEDPLDLGFLEDALKDLDPDVDQQRNRPREAPIDDKSRDREGLGFELTATEEAKLRAYVEDKCWEVSLFSGAPELEKLRVEVVFNLKEDGTLIGEPRVANQLQITTSGNPFWRVAEKAAVDAVVRCAPYDFLPADKYQTWQEVKLNFDPSRMAGF